MRKSLLFLVMFAIAVSGAPARAWHDETHIAIARAAGYERWFNAAGADMAKLKAGDSEKRNHHVINPAGTAVTAETVLDQAARYDDPLDSNGHLYGAIIAALRKYRETDRKGKYAEYHLAFCAHYAGDLSQPLHHLPADDYNKRCHSITDGIINGEVLDNIHLIAVYPIVIRSEADLAGEIARIANLSLQLGRRLKQEGRLLSRTEAYEQISHSASLFRAILKWLGK